MIQEKENLSENEDNEENISNKNNEELKLIENLLVLKTPVPDVEITRTIYESVII